MTTLLTPALPTATTAPTGSMAVSSSAPARGFTALPAFAVEWTAVSTFNTAIEAPYRTVAIARIRQGVSIRWTISTEAKCGMGAVTWAGADARGHDDAHRTARRATNPRLRICRERARPRHRGTRESSGGILRIAHAPGCGTIERADAAACRGAAAPRLQVRAHDPHQPGTVGSRSTLGNPGLPADAKASLGLHRHRRLLAEHHSPRAERTDLVAQSSGFPSRLDHPRHREPRAVRSGYVGQVPAREARRRPVQHQQPHRTSEKRIRP